jgi:anti-sigma B factor antagonist
MNPDSPHTGVQLLAPVGRLDAAVAPRLRQDIAALLSQKAPAIVVNLSAVHYMSSSALRVLLSGHKSAKSMGGALVLCCIRPQVLRIIAMVGFDQVFSIYETEDQARNAMETRLSAGSGRERR